MQRKISESPKEHLSNFGCHFLKRCRRSRQKVHQEVHQLIIFGDEPQVDALRDANRSPRLGVIDRPNALRAQRPARSTTSAFFVGRRLTLTKPGKCGRCCQIFVKISAEVSLFSSVSAPMFAGKY